MSKLIKAFLTGAIAEAKEIVIREDGVNYFDSTMRQRTPGNPEAAGSIFVPEFLTRDDGVVESLEHRLFQDHLADWVEYDNCPNLLPGAIAFRFDWVKGKGDYIHAAIGRLGVVPLASLRKDAIVTIDDRKNTGYISVTVKGELGGFVQHAVAIVTNEAEEGKPPRWTLATVHPGDPINASQVKTDEYKNGEAITVEKAIALGLTDAKIVFA